MEKFKKFLSKYGAAIVFGVAFILFFAFCSLPFINYELKINDVKSYITESFYGFFSNFTVLAGKEPIIVKTHGFIILVFTIACISVVTGLVGLLLPNNKCKYRKALVTTSFVFVLMTIILVPLFNLALGNTIYDAELNIHGTEFVDYTLALILIALILALLALARDTFANTKFTVSEIVEMAMLVALSIALDKIVLFRVGADGGSINLAGIPLIILALRHGPLKGFIASSFTFGILSCLIDGYGLHTYPFDYFIAFSGYCLAGVYFYLLKKFLFKTNSVKDQLLSLNITFVLTGITVILTRMVGSTTSSMLYFFNYLIGDDYHAKFMYALVYNISYIGPSAAISTAACCLLSHPLMLINKRFPTKTVEIEEIEPKSADI